MKSLLKRLKNTGMASEKLYRNTLNMLTPNKFDTFSSTFYQHHNFYKIQMSSPGKNHVTYKSIERVVVG